LNGCILEKTEIKFTGMHSSAAAQQKHKKGSYQCTNCIGKSGKQREFSQMALSLIRFRITGFAALS
jgi:hypothetical protein